MALSNQTDLTMKKKLVLYHCGNPNDSDHSIAKRFDTLFNFAEMLGQELPIDMYYDSGSPQRSLQDAISMCREEDAYLLTYSLSTLSTSTGRAKNIVDALTDELLFVMFVDDQSTLEAIKGGIDE